MCVMQNVYRHVVNTNDVDTFLFRVVQFFFSSSASESEYREKEQISNVEVKLFGYELHAKKIPEHKIHSIKSIY